MADAVWRGSKESLIEYLRGLPANMIHANEEIRQGIADDLMGIFHEAFLQKAQGEEDEAGIKWKPLSESRVRQKLKARQLKGIKKGVVIGTTFGTRISKRREAKKLVRQIRSLTKKLRRYKSEKYKADIKVEISFLKLKLREYGGRYHVRGYAATSTSDILIETHALEQSLDPKKSRKFASTVTPDGTIVIGTTEKPWHHSGFNAKNPEQVRAGKIAVRGVGGEGRKEAEPGREVSLIAGKKMPRAKAMAKLMRALREAGLTSEKAEISRQIRELEAKEKEKSAKGGSTHFVPARPYWPENGALPAPWWQRVLDGVKRRFGQALTSNIMAQEQMSR